MKLFIRRRDKDRAVSSPWYLGFVSYDPRMNETIMAIIPFNFVLSTGRWVYFHLAYGLRLDKPLRETYEKGKTFGHVVGYNRGLLDGERNFRDRALMLLDEQHKD